MKKIVDLTSTVDENFLTNIEGINKFNVVFSNTVVVNGAPVPWYPIEDVLTGNEIDDLHKQKKLLQLIKDTIQAKLQEFLELFPEGGTLAFAPAHNFYYVNKYAKPVYVFDYGDTIRVETSFLIY